jgi:hypothetical protein
VTTTAATLACRGDALAVHPPRTPHERHEFRFYLGTHQPQWLGALDVPLFVSVRSLRDRRTGRLRRRLPVARGPWALDSGAFFEVARLGGFQTSQRAYAAEVHRCAEEIGQLSWAAPQDWMVEEFALARTGLSLSEHQARTVGGYLELRALGLPVIPVLQGRTLGDYEACAARYELAGVDRAALPLVGLGSVCRRQHTGEIQAIVHALDAAGLRLHGFGVKVRGLAGYADALASADSLAWSYQARRSLALPGCTTHRNCANCPRYALRWRARVLAGLQTPRQQRLRLERPAGIGMVQVRRP